MALSKVKITVEDGGLGIVAPTGAQNVVHLDVCTAGVPGQLYAFNSLTNITSKLGLGSGAEAVGYALSVAGGPALIVPVEPSQAGSIGSVSHRGSGTATVTPSKAPVKQVAVSVTSTGAPGAGQYTVALGSSSPTGPFPIPGAGASFQSRVLGTYTTITFANSTYTSGDGYTFATDGTSSGTSGPLITAASNPIDDYNVVLTVIAGGSVGTATCTISLDGYSTGPTQTITSTMVLPNTGIVLTNSGTFVAGDVYSFSTCGPTFSDSDGENAIANLQTNTEFSLIHFNNKHATASAAATFAADVDAACSTLFGDYRFVRAMISCPTSGSVATSGGNLVRCSDTKSSVISAFANQSSTRVGAGAYDAVLSSVLSGQSLRRNFSNVAMARLAQNTPAEDAARVGEGSVPGIIAISNNEFYDEGLSDAGFTVPTTYPGRGGVYINQALTFSFKNNSDYSYFVNGRVMDEACRIAYGVLVDYLNADVLVNPKNGHITNSQATIIENQIDNALTDALIFSVPRQVSAVKSLVDRDNNILSDQTLFVTITITPKGYAREIALRIGFGLQG